MTIKEVKALQKKLAALGYYRGKIDGIRGGKTDAAIVDFKKSIGFRLRPYVGPLTLKALDLATKKIDWITYAFDVLGLHERRDVSALRKWFSKTVSWIDPREIPWCGAFVATAMTAAKHTKTIPENPLLARNWLKYGQDVKPQRGAIMVFSRPGSSWSGHVGFYVGEDLSYYHILGGNQSNAVTITRIRKTRLLGARYPIDENPTGSILRVAAKGTVSVNEA